MELTEKRSLLINITNMYHSVSGQNTDEEVVPENYPRPINGQSGCPHSQLPQLQERTPLS